MMAVFIDYPLLDPPVSPFEKRSSLWSGEEAQQFFQWIVRSQQIRIEYLLRFVKMRIPTNYLEWKDFLLDLGLIYSELLRTPQFSQWENQTASLTRGGVALAFDASLLVADLLMRLPGSTVHWELLLDPGAFSNNHAILRGFANNLYLDPVGGVYEARGLLAGKKSGDLLEQVYSYWKGRIK